MNNIHEYEVYQYVDEEFNRIRIIWIDEKGSYCFYVSLEGDTAMPQIIGIDELSEAIEDNRLVKLPEPYEFANDDSDISEPQLKIRDKAWEIADYLWNNTNNRIEILYKHSRKRVIDQAAKNFGSYEKEIKRIMTRFWQRGMVKNALLPDYVNSGAGGVLRNVNTDEEGNNIKRGRPTNPDKNGIVKRYLSVDNEIKKIIDLSVIQFYKNKKMSIAESYKHMLQKFFSNKLTVNGKEVYEVWDTCKIPSSDEFYYWLKKIISGNFKKFHSVRKSRKDFDLKFRELYGNATLNSFGPGSRYEVDATIANIYLLSKFNRSKIIGRPIVYIIIDTFSRFIAGVYVGLEGPSWIGAMMALDNIVEDKVDFCKKYGIDIVPEMWPNSYLPEKIRADRGEFEGYNVEKLINNLGVAVENTPPYRGDLKGIVERNFRTIKGKIRHLLPGAIQKEFRERGDKDYRLDATLDLDEFTAIIILNIIRHNNSIINGYPREKGLIVDDIPPIPVEILKWGMKNRRCGYKINDRNIIRLNLLPNDVGTLTRYGIKFKNLYYSSDEASENEWFINPKNEKIKISYDPRCMNNIYVPMNKGKDFMQCSLTDKCSTYRNLSIDEITFHQELETSIIEECKDNQNQVDVNFISETQRIVEKAKNKNKNNLKYSDKSRLEDIGANKTEEKQKRRVVETFNLSNENTENRQVVGNSLRSDTHEESLFESGVMLDILNEGDN